MALQLMNSVSCLSSSPHKYCRSLSRSHSFRSPSSSTFTCKCGDGMGEKNKAAKGPPEKENNLFGAEMEPEKVHSWPLDLGNQYALGTGGGLGIVCMATFVIIALLVICPTERGVTHSMPPQKLEIFKSLESWAEKSMLMHLKPVEKSWQPSDFLPESESEEFHDQVRELRERCRELPDEYFVVLVGDMIAEEALPTYQSTMNSLDGVRDETGVSLSPWAVWIRAWTAEENRHGDLLNKYLYLSGRVDMKPIEKTIQYLIGSGMDPKFENNPYNGFIYTSIQERATFITHGNTAKLAKQHGDLKLAQICRTIAADEKRHETAYTEVVEKLFEFDPDETILALAAMMKKKIKMPAHLMYDGQDDSLFKHYTTVLQRLGVYTANDYADILEFLVGRWSVEKLSGGLSGEGRRAQDFVCGLAPRIRKLGEKAEEKRTKHGCSSGVPFSWIFGREIGV